MAFGTELQGRACNEALLGVQDAELRLLENIKKCLTQRIKCDRDYATSLDAFVAIAHKLGSIEFMTPVCQVTIRLSAILYERYVNYLRTQGVPRSKLVNPCYPLPFW